MTRLFQAARSRETSAPTATSNQRMSQAGQYTSVGATAFVSRLPQSVRRFFSVRSRPVGCRGRLAAATVLLICAAAATVLMQVNPADHPGLPTCPSLALGGVICPGCGSTRATHHLLNGRFGTAIRFNPALIVIGLPFLVLLLVQCGLAMTTGRLFQLHGSTRLGYALLWVLVAYLIARNLPFEALDVIRPPTPANGSTSS
jgi:hypothetical protein